MKKYLKPTFFIPILFSAIPVLLLIVYILLMAYCNYFIPQNFDFKEAVHEYSDYIRVTSIPISPIIFIFSIVKSVQHYKNHKQNSVFYRNFPLITTIIIQGLTFVLLMLNVAIAIVYLTGPEW